MGIPENFSNDSNVIAAVTGATGAIGKAIATGIAAASPNNAVVLFCRNEKKAQKAVDEITKRTKNLKVGYKLVNVSNRDSIYDLASRWDKPLHILVNNAAVTPRQRSETPSRIEMQFATNVLGYFWMIEAFKDHLTLSAPAHVINIASYWAGGLDLTDLEFKRRKYNNGTAYRQSKQANRMLTVAHSRHLKPGGVRVNSCHPGDVNSMLSNDLGFGGHESPTQGARTPVWLATSSEPAQETGSYFEHLKKVQDPFSSDLESIEHLFQACQHYT